MFHNLATPPNKSLPNSFLMRTYSATVIYIVHLLNYILHDRSNFSVGSFDHVCMKGGVTQVRCLRKGGSKDLKLCPRRGRVSNIANIFRRHKCMTPDC